jgi:hypothetical protein
VTTAGCTATGAATGGGVSGLAAGAGAGARRAMSSGRITTAMNAAASPTIAEMATKVRNLKIGRGDMDRIFLVG